MAKGRKGALMPLENLLSQDAELKQYFNSLPDYVQETIRERANNIDSAITLRRYVESITSGDK